MIALPVCAQKKEFVIRGTVVDQENQPLSEAYIFTLDKRQFTFSDEQGNFILRIKSDKPVTVICSYTQANERRGFDPNVASEFIWNVKLPVTYELKTVKVSPDKQRIMPGKINLDPKKVERFPVLQFEQVLKSIGLGVSQAGGELSSAYNVRGGNFDENLIYVNDVEIYRPFLVRSGQQEGLSFINPDMVKELDFSAGGWEAQYGDKMASVLDVQYRRPSAFAARTRVSLLGAEAQVEGSSFSGRLTYIAGVRYRTNQYFLGALDVQGDYKPVFADYQSLISFRLNKEWSVEALTNMAYNRFLLLPQSQTTSFGTVRNAIRLYVGFGGQEKMQYENFLQSLTLRYQPDIKREYKWINSIYAASEQEHLTVEGAYYLDQLESDLGSENFSQPKLRLGQGYFVNHARNDLYARILSSSILGKEYRSFGILKYGLKVQSEFIDDVLKEWRYNDSAGYRQPQNESFNFDRSISSTNLLNSMRYTAYVQNTAILMKTNASKLNVGVRVHHWSLNQQTVWSPRVRFSFEPNKKYNDTLRSEHYELYDSLKKKDLLITAAAGYYFQPPFYRELRDFEGNLNLDLRAQKSIHFILGTDLNFKAWGRPFKWITEVYYKHLEDLVPYTLENVRIRYYARNSSHGNAMGFDTRVNGEFIQGLESWFNFSLMSTRENISYVNEEGTKVESGFIRRPTDQRVSFSILFQDELPSNPSYKMNLNVVFGSRLPYYLGGNARYQEGNTIPPYRRVDLGFSKTLIEKKPGSSGRIKSLWISLEVFNLLQVNNTISYVWIKDINNNTYGVPNYLTGRRINFRIFMQI